MSKLPEARVLGRVSFKDRLNSIGRMMKTYKDKIWAACMVIGIASIPLTCGLMIKADSEEKARKNAKLEEKRDALTDECLKAAGAWMKKHAPDSWTSCYKAGYRGEPAWCYVRNETKPEFKISCTPEGCWPQ